MMRFTVMQQPFQNALRAVGGALSTRNTVPTLNGIYLEARGAQVVLRATDLEHAIRLELPAGVAAEGAVVLPGRYLVELVRRLPPGEIAFSVDAGSSTARVLCADSDFTVHGFAPDQFPPEPVPGEERVTIDTGALRALLRQTGFAVAHDESRPWFTGVHLVIRGETAEAMATDSAVLAYSRVAVTNPFDLTMGVIIPGRAVAELNQLLAGSEAEECDIIPVHNQLLFRLGTVTLTTRLLEGQYPDFRRVLPATFPSTATIDRLRFVESCEREALVAKDGAMHLAAAATGIELTARTPELGRLVERVPATITGDPFTVDLNVRFVLEGLRSMGGDQVLVEFAGPHSAVRCRSSADAQAFFAVMPLLSF